MSGAGSIAAVSFDAGGTLLEPWPSVGHVYAAGAHRLGLGPVDPDRLNQRFRAAWQRQRDFDYAPGSWAALVADTFDGLVPAPADPRLFRDVYDRFADPQAWRVYPDVRPTLAALAAAGCPMVVVSNWDERLRPLLAGLGLADHLAEVVISREVGCHKPDPRIFHHAAARLGVAPGRILHVGDRPAEDRDGARAAGWQALWLRRGTAPAELGSDEIADLTAVAARCRPDGGEPRGAAASGG